MSRKSSIMLRFLNSLLFLLAVLAVSDQAMSHLTSGPHIADVNLLLPPKMTYPVEYRLQGSDGCFKWSWDHHDILSVLPEYNLSSHCSTSARVRSIAPYSGRKETAVYATDVHSGTVIRCKVFIDHFSRIQIFHNSIKLDLDGLATLRARAFDREDNVFSSLVGLQFLWQLVPATDDSSHHLEHVPLKDSPLSDCGGLCGDLDIQITLEDKGKYSDLFVLRGVAIGHETVSVRLVEPGFEHMGDKIALTVAEAMAIYPPSPVVVLVGATVHYSLKVIRRNTPQVINLPSPHHRWSVLNSSIAEVDGMLGQVRALRLGVTTAFVEDTRVLGHVQQSCFQVVIPDSLYLYILPLSHSGDPVEGVTATSSVQRWHIVSGRQYIVQMKVFTEGPGAEEVFITETDDPKFLYNQSSSWMTFLVSDIIASKHDWKNSRILKAVSPGLGKLTASLTYYGENPERKEVLKVVQEVVVCEPVRVSFGSKSSSQGILLPWMPAVYQEVELKGTGGCAKTPSDYNWFSSDTSIVSVSASGVVLTKKPGKATIKVVSVFDSINFDEIVLEVSIPSSMLMLPNFPVETVVGSQLQAAVTMKTLDGAYFDKCDAFSSVVSWKVSSDSFIIVNGTTDKYFSHNLEFEGFSTTADGPPCAWTYIRASGTGQAWVHATVPIDHYQFEHHFGGPTGLKASTRIASYEPLTVHQADDGSQCGGYWFDVAHSGALDNLDSMILAPETHMNVILLGGPEKWDTNVHFIETVDVLGQEDDQQNGLLVHGISDNGKLYRVFCQSLGTFQLLFKRGNLVGNNHQQPAVAEVTLSVTCIFPSSIVLLADEPVNDPNVISAAARADRSPERVHTSPISITNGKTIRVAAVGMTDSGKPFANASSLLLEWELSNCEGLASWDVNYDLRWSKSSWERYLVLHNASGLCTVRARAVGFMGSMDRSYSTSSAIISDNHLTDTIHLQLVSTLKVEPMFSLLLFNPDAKVNLSIIGGSCFVNALVNDSRVLEVLQPPPGQQCLQLTLAPKGLGSAVVTVNDVGLAPPISAQSLVRVADVEWIRIASPEEISLMEGSSQLIDIIAGVDDDCIFDSSQFAYMKIHVHIEAHMVHLVNNDLSILSDGYINTPKFSIMAKHVGVTTLFVSCRQSTGHEILSQAIKVEVYEPPRIFPHDIFLAPGASFVFTVTGGPKFGAIIEYSTMNNATAAVHRSSGQLSAISPGNTTLVALFYGNRDVVLCQAYGSIRVGVPSSMILNVQSEELNVGLEMPIFLSLTEGSLFSFYELCKNYKWSIEDEKVLNFSAPDHSHGNIPSLLTESSTSSYLGDEDFGFARMLFGRSAGRTKVAVSFSCQFVSSSYSQTKSYSESISLLVVPNLPLALGVAMTWILPPHYVTSRLLPVSSHLHGQRNSQIHKATVSYSLLRSCSRKNDEMPKDGISIDGDRIRTSDTDDLACIVAKDRTIGKAEIASCIRVAEVAQIRIARLGLGFPVARLAVGAELKFPVNYFDVLGNPFHEAHNVISFAAVTNYPNVAFVNYTNDGGESIYIKALSHGEALVQVSANHNPQKADYVLISVGVLVYPQNPVLYRGSTLNFSVEGSNNQSSGQWHSSNENVIYVHPMSGEAEAVGEGIAQVSFESLGLKLGTMVIVPKEDILVVDALNKTLTNVPLPTKGYYFAVDIRSDTYGLKSDVYNDNIRDLYECRVDPPFAGYTKPWRDPDSGKSFCLFFPYSPEHLVRSLPKSKDMKPHLSVSIHASLRDDSRISGSASALLIGGFSVLELRELNLTPEYNSTILTIFGNTDVEIHWHGRDTIMISPIHREDFGLGGRAQYEVKVLKPKRFRDRIVITLPANGQTVEIDVSYEPGRKPISATTSSLTIWASVLGSLTMLILAATISLCYLDRPNRPAAHADAPATPNRTALVNADSSSPSVTNGVSPRTPQPFVDYVRRTIDETPYYKRESRRRFNPQNTY